MASLTIRNLNETAKQALRERAARNGRSMEEEARVLLAGLPSAGASPPLLPENSERLTLPANLPVTGADHRLAGKRILLIISGGIAAYKSLDLIRRLRERGAAVRVIMTRASTQFITPLSVGALTADRVFLDLFDREDEQDVGHIRLARETDLIVVAPATADLMAKMAHGIADDLASTVLLAARTPILLAPAMNPAMWSHPATVRNRKVLEDDGIMFCGPEKGEMAEKDEAGTGRMSEPLEIARKIAETLDDRPKPLKGRRAVVTSGPTHEPIDPVRYIANRSSGKQGHLIAEALAELGAEVILVSGPVAIPQPKSVEFIQVQTARQMLEAVERSLPADIAVMVAAVADWRVENAPDRKIKKVAGTEPPSLSMVENPDILKTVGHHEKRPYLVVGFAAETDDVERHAAGKRKRKNADWIVANDVSSDSEVPGGVMGGDSNQVTVLKAQGSEVWPTMDKRAVARRLAAEISEEFQQRTDKT